MVNPIRHLHEVVDHFKKHNILIGPEYPVLERYIRVSLGTPTEMQEFWRVWDLITPPPQWPSQRCPIVSKSSIFGTQLGREAPVARPEVTPSEGWLLQLYVVRLGLLQDGDVGISVFP